MNSKMLRLIFMIMFIVVCSVGCSGDHVEDNELHMSTHEEAKENSMYTDEELKFYPKLEVGEKVQNHL